MTEPRVEFVDFGEWGRHGLVAEYDGARDTIRINADAVARVEAAYGAAEADRLVASALAHERFHRAHPGAGEAAAHAHVRSVTGEHPARIEALVRRSVRTAPGDER